MIDTALLTLAQAEAEGKTLLEHITSGGPIGFVILLLSLVATALVVTHAVHLRMSKLAPPDILEELEDLLKRREVAKTVAFCEDEDNDSMLSRIIGAGARRSAASPFGTLEFRAAVEEAGQEEVARLYRFTEGLALIASVAPMLGLLGTVVGIVGAFDQLGNAEGGFARPDQLAGDISVALITTALGLALAIPCTAFLTLFRNRIDHLASVIEQNVEDLLAGIEGPAPAAPQRAAPRAPAPRAPAEPAR